MPLKKPKSPPKKVQPPKSEYKRAATTKKVMAKKAPKKKIPRRNPTAEELSRAGTNKKGQSVWYDKKTKSMTTKKPRKKKIMPKKK